MNLTRNEVEQGQSIPLTQAEKDSFRAYAEDSKTETDGTQCQWADYTIRLLDENERLKAENEQHFDLQQHNLDTINRQAAVVEAIRKVRLDNTCGMLVSLERIFKIIDDYDEALAQPDGGK